MNNFKSCKNLFLPPKTPKIVWPVRRVAPYNTVRRGYRRYYYYIILLLYVYKCTYIYIYICYVHYTNIPV